MPKRIMEGQVVSDKPEQTIVVRVERKYRHPVYGKFIRRSSKFHVHDPQNRAKTGDTVTIRECRPVSKLKRWELIDDTVGKE